MEYYSAIKKNSFESVLMRWMKLEPIIQSEVSQKDKDHYSSEFKKKFFIILPPHTHFKKKKICLGWVFVAASRLFSLVAVSRSYSLAVVHGLLTGVTSLVGEHGF